LTEKHSLVVDKLHSVWWNT